MRSQAIEVRLRRCLPDVDAAALKPLAEALLSAWSEPQRAYHTPQHLQECLAGFDTVCEALQWPAAVELALIFHDAVYEPQRHDNEQRSADWAVSALTTLGAGKVLCERVAALVMATQSHQPPAGDSSPEDTALLLDIDLSILGSAPARFAEYEQQIRREYHFVPEAQYQAARQRVMQGFAQRPRLFQSEHFTQRLAAAAARNLRGFA